MVIIIVIKSTPLCILASSITHVADLSGSFFSTKISDMKGVCQFRPFASNAAGLRAPSNQYQHCISRLILTFLTFLHLLTHVLRAFLQPAFEFGSGVKTMSRKRLRTARWFLWPPIESDSMKLCSVRESEHANVFAE